MILNKRNKIFCISFQRTGTTSVGKFFKEHGFKVAGYDRKRSADWSKKRFIGDYEGVFNSKGFKKNQVFEDNPWWENDFYKVLYHRFPKSKFILFTRNPEKWFDSMISHSKGKTLGNTFIHCKLYRREDEYYEGFPNKKYYGDINNIDNLLDLNEAHRQHYKYLYNLRNKEIQDFFNEYSPNSLFVGELEDSYKWKKLGGFLNLEVADNYEVHINKSFVR